VKGDQADAVIGGVVLHGRHATAGWSGAETPRGGIFSVPIQWRRVPPRGIPGGARGATLPAC
jgi:hypothetical protein